MQLSKLKKFKMIYSSYISAILLLFFATTSPAYAYLDPVTGSLIIQGLIALVAAIVAGVKSVRLKIMGFFSSIFKRKP